jgi:hypothetical protein
MDDPIHTVPETQAMVAATTTMRRLVVVADNQVIVAGVVDRALDGAGAATHLAGVAVAVVAVVADLLLDTDHSTTTPEWMALTRTEAAPEVVVLS